MSWSIIMTLKNDPHSASIKSMLIYWRVRVTTSSPAELEGTLNAFTQWNSLKGGVK